MSWPSRDLSSWLTQACPFSLDCLPQPAYLVGGSTRDFLLKRRITHPDLDFVLPTHAVETAQRIAHHHQAGFVLLDAERQIARVVFPELTVDFAQQEGATIERDLHRRDFTINAIAYETHTETLIDPLQGQADLQQRLIRQVNRSNLEADPLRLLRAYRQAAQLDFTIESQTQAEIRRLAGLLSRVAAERIQTELDYLLQSAQGVIWLKAAYEDGVLQLWLPSLTSSGLVQAAAVDPTAQHLCGSWPGFSPRLTQIVSLATSPANSTAQARSTKAGAYSWLDLARLMCLLSETPDQAAAELLRLKYSRTIIRAATTVLQGLQILHLGLHSRREQYFFFQKVGPVFPAMTVLAVAKGFTIDGIALLVDRYLNPTDPVAHPQPLVTGQDLMDIQRIPAGPQIGRLLEAIQIAQAEGQISTPAEALQLAANLLAHPDHD